MRFVAAAGLGLILLTIVEIVVFVVVAQQIGLPWALGAALVLSILGGWLVRREGLRGWRRFRAAVVERRPPGAEAIDGVIGIGAALLLVAPGFLSAVLGLLFLTPPVRAGVRILVRRATERRIPGTAAGDLFGPRKVRRMRTAPADAATVAAEPPPAPDRRPTAAIEGDVIEGEIIDPRR